MSYIYMSSPYTHEDPKVMEERYLDVMEASSMFLNLGKTVFSPIVHCHEMAQRYAMPTDFAFWKAYNEDMLKGAKAMCVVCIEGWKESVGVKGEIEYCEENGIKVFYLPWE